MLFFPELNRIDVNIKHQAEEQVRSIKKIEEDLDKAIDVIKIEITPDEKKQLAVNLKEYLQWLEPLLNVDTSGLVEMINSHGAVNVLRDDKAQGGDRQLLQQSASDFDEGFYQVPPVIE